MENDLHHEHRQRMKERIAAVGMAGLQDHEILEYLLFHCIRRKNTNPIAHNLMNRFGSLSSVLDAGREELSEVEGMGEVSATFLKFIADLGVRYLNDKSMQTQRFSSMDRMGEYFLNHYLSFTDEHVELILLDRDMRMLGHVRVMDGNLDESSIDINCIAEHIYGHNAASFAIAHNHLKNTDTVSEDDLRATLDVYRALMPMNKLMLEHFVISEGKYRGILDRVVMNSERY